MDIGRIEIAVRTVRNQAGFIKLLLGDGLDWPIEQRVTKVEDIAYGWSKDDLQIEDMEKHFVDGQIWQIQPLDPGRKQPWGIFLLEFARPDVFTSGRGITGPLRRILRRLIPKRRQQANHAVWNRENLLFICTHNYEHFSIAYFKKPPEGSNTAPLAIFGWGPDIPARTAIDFNLPALDWPADDVPPEKWVEQWATAFDVEKVTRKFYGDYDEVFRAVEDIIDKHCDLPGDSLRIFTQMLFNRLMFLRFIERKGWLNPGGNPNYLQELYATTPPKESFYKTRLRRLFFEGLALENHSARDVIGDVPFLNGGLFKEGPLDKKVDDIPNAAFELILGKIDGIFYHYNFTVEESTPLNIQVAVDPEMLGMVFEKLVTGRHETGSYYTPRPVVHFMCREAIKGYLADKTGVTADAIAQLVDKHDVSGLTETNARKVIDALDSLKAVDPACGSGAYLLGLLQEMIELYRLLYSEKLTRDSRSLYDLKFRIISHNLYGVDIDQFATNIAMLRLWLSIAVDSNEPLPLPNLKYKIETGDSLLGECYGLLGRGGLHGPEIDSLTLELARLTRDHVKTHDDKKEEELNQTIQAKKKYLKGLLGVTDEHTDWIVWPAEYPEVFAPRGEHPDSAPTDKGFAVKETFAPGGFDVVLTNPPYVRQELITSIKPYLKQQFPEVYAGAADLYVYFYARAFQMLRTGGVLSFIAPNKFFRAQYGEKLRAHFLDKSRLLDLIDFGDYPIFQAITYPSIIVAQKTAQTDEAWAARAVNWDSSDNLIDITRTVDQQSQRLPQVALSSESWRIIGSSMTKLIQKLRNAGQALKELIDSRLYRGILTGFNEAFVIDGATRARLVSEHASSSLVLKPFLRGRDVKRWHCRFADQYLIRIESSENVQHPWSNKSDVDAERVFADAFPAIYAHLDPMRTRLIKRYDQGKYFWELRSCAYWPVFDAPKIVYQVIATYQQFAYTEEPFVSNDKTWIIPAPPDGLLGFLNSKVAWFFLDQITAKLQGGAFELRSPYMAQLPVPTLSKDLNTKTRELWELMLSGDPAAEAVQALESEIDEIVVGLCGLTPGDVKIIDEAVLAAGNRFRRSTRTPDAEAAEED